MSKHMEELDAESLAVDIAIDSMLESIAIGVSEAPKEKLLEEIRAIRERNSDQLESRLQPFRTHVTLETMLRRVN